MLDSHPSHPSGAVKLPKYNETIGRANKLASVDLLTCLVVIESKACRFEAYARDKPNVPVLPATPDPRLPSHITSVFYPTDVNERDDGNFWPKLGQKIRFRKPESGQIVQCTVQDYGTSKLKGNWFEVLYDDEDEEVNVTEREMRGVLTAAQRYETYTNHFYRILLMLSFYTQFVI